MSKQTANVGPSSRLHNEQLVDAVLQGGPVSFPETLRECRVHAADEVVKVPHLNGYEHFERCADEAPDNTPIVFQWSFSTRIAE